MQRELVIDASGGADRTIGEGDDRRFAVLIEPEIGFLRRVSGRIAPRGLDPEDLTQEGLIKAFLGLDRFDGRHPRAWLRRIAVNTAISAARRRRFDEVPFGDRDPEPVGVPRGDNANHLPEIRVMDGVLDPVLEEALGRLSSDHRRVVELVDLASYSYEDAARLMGVPVGTVMSRLHRARHRLRSALAGTHLDRVRIGEPQVRVAG